MRWSRLLAAVLLAIVVIAGAGCSLSGSTLPVVKIGLLAPFEGELRHVGYQRLYGVKLALQEVNLSGGLGGHKYELVALNDYGEPTEAILQAQELVIDSNVLGVVDQWQPELSTAVAPTYTAASLTTVSPPQFTDFASLPPTFAADYQSLSGSSPNDEARQAYLATRHLLQGIASAAETSGGASRESVWKAMQNR